VPDVDGGLGSVRFAKDYVGIDYHNEGHSHVDAWVLVANGLATPAVTPIPVLVLAAGAAATLLMANLVATAPAWCASHVPPGPSLRAE
jgi:hypothetical protein